MDKIIVIEFEIRTKDLVHIGSGRISEKGADTALALFDHLIYKEIKILPSATFKGILRKAANRVINLVDQTWKPCNTVEPGRLLGECRGEGFEWLELYGLPWMKNITAPLIVDGLYLFEQDSLVYTHTAIDSKTLTVRKGALYSIEYLPPNTVLTGRIIINVEHDLFTRVGLGKLIKLLLLSIMESTAIGLGRGSRAFEIRIKNKDDVLRSITKLSSSDETKYLEDIRRILDKLSEFYSVLKPLEVGRL